MIIPANQKKTKVPGYHDPDSKRLVSLVYKPPAWQANTVYYWFDSGDYDTVIPNVFAGVYFKVINPGKSGAIEPTWPTVVGDTVQDGGVLWECVAYNLGTSNITISTIETTIGVTISGATSTPDSVQFFIDPFTAALSNFEVTNHITRANGSKDDRTLVFRVAQL